MKGSHSGKIEPQGPFVDILVMASPERVKALKAAGRPFPHPATIRALIDTGASGSVVDVHVLAGLGLKPTGAVLIHTPSTGSKYETRDAYDVSIALGAGGLHPREFIVSVIGADLASEGFYALIGWNILDHCKLSCNGPARKYTLRF